ncbi:hypothetical protein PGTUg99_012036 [Puccinia graminis f. sp. tritici]|uniref:Uncharacterized protein n=1 Tax=Puccinia graminis f. sp. tritici TaxID=56615 RepID=A0A5B0Q7Y0_PUCGR|nr:hypothetical protein PGTUg99_012036 [Puccinia graminis f. sp. tritici]
MPHVHTFGRVCRKAASIIHLGPLVPHLATSQTISHCKTNPLLFYLHAQILLRLCSLIRYDVCRELPISVE